MLLMEPLMLGPTESCLHQMRGQKLQNLEPLAACLVTGRSPRTP